MNLPNGVIIVRPETASDVVAANARVTVVVLESIPLGVIQNLGEKAMSIVYDALDSAVSRSKVVDVSR